MKLNKKGFTLVELLAVVVVLALLMVVAANSIGSALDNSKKKALFTETEKLFNGITSEAQSLKILGELETDDGQTKLKNSFNGIDGDFTYKMKINTHGYITSLSVCYKTDYNISVDASTTVSNADEENYISTMDDGYTTKLFLNGTVASYVPNNTSCSGGLVEVSDS